MKRSPIKAKRDEPRRSLGRIQHERMSRKPADGPNAAEKRHMGRVAALGCCVCKRPAQVHHITSDGFQRITRRHDRVIPLCSDHHTDGPDAIHKSHKRFAETFDIHPLGLAEQLWAEIEEACL